MDFNAPVFGDSVFWITTVLAAAALVCTIVFSWVHVLYAAFMSGGVCLIFIGAALDQAGWRQGAGHIGNFTLPISVDINGAFFPIVIRGYDAPYWLGGILIVLSVLMFFVTRFDRRIHR